MYLPWVPTAAEFQQLPLSSWTAPGAGVSALLLLAQSRHDWLYKSLQLQECLSCRVLKASTLQNTGKASNECLVFFQATKHTSKVSQWEKEQLWVSVQVCTESKNIGNNKGKFYVDVFKTNRKLGNRKPVYWSLSQADFCVWLLIMIMLLYLHGEWSLTEQLQLCDTAHCCWYLYTVGQQVIKSFCSQMGVTSSNGGMQYGLLLGESFSCWLLKGWSVLHGKDWCFPLASLPVTVREKIGGWMNFWPNPVCLFLCFKDTVNYART